MSEETPKCGCLRDPYRGSGTDPFVLCTLAPGHVGSHAAEGRESWPRVEGERCAPEKEPERGVRGQGGCPDAGTCHHECERACWRVFNAEPLSVAGWGAKWPRRVREQELDKLSAPARAVTATVAGEPVALVGDSLTLFNPEERSSVTVRLDVASWIEVTVGERPALSDPDAQQLGPFARESQTSRRAAVEAYPRQGSQRWQILDLLGFMSGTRKCGATRDEIAETLKLSPNTVRPRVKELIDGGWIEVCRPRQDRGDDSPLTRPSSAGRESEVLVLTAAAREYAVAEQSNHDEGSGS